MKMELLNAIYDRLQDDESKIIFEMRLQMCMEGNYRGFLEGLIAMDKQWEISQYDDCISICKGREVIVFGAGIDGKMTLHLLLKNGIRVDYYCDNDQTRWGKKFCEIPIISLAELKTRHSNAYVILASQTYAPVFYRLLIDGYFPRENICYPRIGSLFATTGWQYFDCPGMVHDEEEIFVDCGCYDGETSKEFVKWCHGKYKEIIAFEPDKRSREIAMKNCSDIDNMSIYPYATGEKREQASFRMGAGGGSRIAIDGDESIIIESIDDVLGGKKATFIKMDIEGAELASLRGAIATIRKYKPKLAICIYHKAEDFMQIPEFLLECRNDYKFFIRHYTNCTFETVLYAI